MNAIELNSPQPASRMRFFSLRGRLGRAHYIAYSLGAIVLAFLFMLLAGLGLMMAGGFGRMLYIVISVLLYYCLLPVLFTVLTVRRAHDFNAGGWVALLLLVPVVNLLFWFIPGTRSDNSYGPVPQAPSAGIKLVAVLLPVLLIGAFLAIGGLHNPQQAVPAPVSQPLTPLKPYTP